jgi:hypothetical protein
VNWLFRHPRIGFPDLGQRGGEIPNGDEEEGGDEEGDEEKEVTFFNGLSGSLTGGPTAYGLPSSFLWDQFVGSGGGQGERAVSARRDLDPFQAEASGPGLEPAGCQIVPRLLRFNMPDDGQTERAQVPDQVRTLCRTNSSS